MALWPRARYNRRSSDRKESARRKIVIKILQDNEERLKRLPNVHHIGISNKLVGGRNTCRWSVTIYVTKKRRRVKASDKIPCRLKAKIRGKMRTVQTDVCELPGAPRLFNMRGGERIVSSDSETGTAGLVFSHRGRQYCITNAHVITDPGLANSFSLVGPASGTVVLRDSLPLGQPVESDAALILINTPVDSWQFHNTNGVLRGFADEISIGQACFYVATSSGVVPPFTFRCQLIAEVHSDTDIEVDGSILKYRGFYRFGVLNGSPVGGHSGALVCLEGQNGLFGVGLAFGGIEGQEIWAFPARRCFDRMMAFFDN